MSQLAFLHSQFLATLPKPTRSLAGKTVLVTGSNTGLGKEAARHFVRLGASTVILAVRSLDKGEAAKADILRSTKATTDTIRVWHLDMQDYDSVLAFAARCEKELPRLDIALLNAGTASTTWKMAGQDESNITVNVTSTFLLGLALLPQLKATGEKYGARTNLTFVASEVHAWAQFPQKDTPKDKSIFDALNDPACAADMGERYQVTKLLEVLAVRGMCDERSSTAIPVTINYVNPGLCHSELGRDMGLMFTLFKLVVARSTELGSRTLVDAAMKGPESHGMYCSDCRVALPSEFVLSEKGWEVQQRVWTELKEKLERIRPGITSNM
jgi:NAD(P)-dependent dehydrogenase (short-subunit alcohol dehydrogenase family)